MVFVMNLLLVLCTFPNQEVARQIGTTLVEAQLAACVNLCPNIESIYRWEGKVERAGEVLGIFKTAPSAFPHFERRLVELHPYEVPEIIALRPESAAAAYAAWVLNETRP